MTVELEIGPHLARTIVSIVESPYFRQNGGAGAAIAAAFGINFAKITESITNSTLQGSQKVTITVGE